jgi:hypothetical protein
MRYPDGQLARLGDRLRLWDGVERTIVCSLNTDEYSAAYPRSEWNCLKTGVLVHSAQTGRHVEHRVPRLRLDLCDTGAHALVAPLFGLTLLQRRHGRSDRCRRSFVLQSSRRCPQSFFFVARSSTGHRHATGMPGYARHLERVFGRCLKMAEKDLPGTPYVELTGLEFSRASRGL